MSDYYCTEELDGSEPLLRIVMLCCIPFFIVFIWYNISIYNNFKIAIACLIMFFSVLYDLIYILIKKSSFHNILISISLFLLFSLTILLWGSGGVEKNSWVYILPLICFYTQGTKRGLFLVTILYTGIISIWLLDSFLILEANNFITIRQITILTLISLMTFIYQKSSQNGKKAIAQQLYFDRMTNLPNRSHLLQDLKCDQDKILALINVDSFKEVNDLYGTKVGDTILIELGRRISKIIVDCPSFKLFKLHSDEYALFSNRLDCYREFIGLIRKLPDKLSRLIKLDDIYISITVSIGVARNSNRILAEADLALKKAKESKTDIVVYHPSMRMTELYRQNHSMVMKLRSAINSDNIVPFFQPIYNLETNIVDRYESLVRICEKKSVISPYSFIELSKKSKLYHCVSRQMIKKTFEYFTDKDYDFSINLCLDDFLNNETTDFFFSEVKKYKIGHKLILELLESQNIEDCYEVEQFIEEARALGCRIAVDDFGSGYSNFEYLLRINVDYIKIDSSLIRNLVTDPNAQVITRNITQFAKDLGIKTIAEFVHDKNTFLIAKELGVDYAQGYYIGRPEKDLNCHNLYVSS